MKFVYCIHSICNPGGMERVLLNKVRWLVAHGHEVVIVTTDQKRRPAFYPFPGQVRQIDLDINYSDDNALPTIGKCRGYLRRRRLHKRELTAILHRERPDFTISLYPCESTFIPSIDDGSKKILEFHYSKNFRLQYGRGGLMGMLDRYRTRADERLVRRFDRFVVLSEEDARSWGAMSNMSVIPNAAMMVGSDRSDCSARRVIAVGRLDYQKGFDRLIQAWDIVKKSPSAAGWRLDIFGQGEWKEKLEKMIADKGLHDSAAINAPVSDIGREYSRSSMLVMSSNYEGFPMVMIEAMSAGLPAVAFDFKCGPRDIIDDGTDGLIVRNGDIGSLAAAMLRLIEDGGLRRAMGQKARNVTERYSEEKVMAQWMDLFKTLAK